MPVAWPSQNWWEMNFLSQTCTETPVHFSFSLYSAKDIEQYLNTILHCPNKSCENDKYVFHLQGHLTIIFCTLSCFVCSQCSLVFTLLFLLHIKTKFPTLSRRGRRSAWSQQFGSTNNGTKTKSASGWGRHLLQMGTKIEFILLFWGFPLVCHCFKWKLRKVNPPDVVYRSRNKPLTLWSQAEQDDI